MLTSRYDILNHPLNLFNETINQIMKANLQKCNILPLIHTKYLFKMCKIKTHITINEYQKWQAIENKNKYICQYHWLYQGNTKIC